MRRPNCLYSGDQIQLLNDSEIVKILRENENIKDLPEIITGVIVEFDNPFCRTLNGSPILVKLDTPLKMKDGRRKPIVTIRPYEDEFIVIKEIETYPD